MAEQPVPDVIVGEPVAAKLANHLHQQGRLQGGVTMVIASLNKAVDRKWGVAAESFTDTAGPGWIIDVSEYFNDEMLYAIIRREHGIRSVVAVVDEEELGGFKKTGRWASPEAASAGLSESADMVGDTEVPVQLRPAMRQPVQLVPKPDDPRLIVWWAPDSEEDPGSKTPIAQHTTYADAQDMVMRLLMSGCKVEVWSLVKHPELTVDI